MIEGNGGRYRRHRHGAAIAVAALLLAPSLATGASAQPAPEPASQGTADLGVSLSISEPAPLVGSGFEVVASVVNAGPDAAAETELVINFGPGMEYASATSTDPADSCSLQTYSSSGSDAPSEPESYPYYEGASVTCALGTVASGAGETITLSFTRTAASASPIDGGVYSALSDPDYANNYDAVELGPDRSNPAETSLAIAGPSAAPVGTTFDYGITLTNRGPSSAEQAILIADIPGGLELVDVAGTNCTIEDPGTQEPVRPDPYSFRRVRCDIGSIPSGTASEVVLTVRRDLPDELYLSSWFQISNHQEDRDDDYASARLGADTSTPADIVLTMTAPDSPPMDQSFDIKVVAWNKGPNPAADVRVTEVLPEGLAVGTVQASSGECVVYDAGPGPEPMPADGSAQPEPYTQQEVICTFPSIGVGAKPTIVVTVTRSNPWELWPSAWVSAGTYDPDHESNYVSARINADPSVTSDLVVSMEGPAGTPVVGTSFAYSFTVTNKGPAEAVDVYVDTYIPDGSRLESSDPDPSVQCGGGDYGGDPAATEGGDDGGSAPSSEGSGFGSVYPGYSSSYLSCRVGSLPAGASARVRITATRTRAHALWLSASAYARNFDPTYEDNYGELSIAPDESEPADLTLTLERPGRPALDSRFTIAGRVSNRGPSVAKDIVASVAVPAGTELVSATIAGGSCVVDEAPVVYTHEGDPAGAQDDSGGTSYPERPYGSGTVACSRPRLDAGRSASVDIELVRRSAYEMWVGGWVLGATWDPVPGNDQAGVLIEGKPYRYQCENPPPPPATMGPEDCPEGSVCGGKGSDSIVVGDCAVASGAGDDSVEMTAGPSAGGSTVRAGGGADRVVVDIIGRSDKRRRFEVRAGSGNDAITILAAPDAGNATVVVYGGRGQDTITIDSALARRSLRVIVHAGAGRDEVRVPGLARRAPGTRIRGGPGDDTVFAGSGPDRVYGGGGRDLLDGRAGDDLVDGGRRKDRCRGGPGRDRVLSC